MECEFVKLLCQSCDNVEEIPLKILIGDAEISCSSCGALIVETKASI